MSGAALEKAASLIAPIAAAGDQKGLKGVYRYAIDGTQQSLAIPAELRGKYITMFCSVEMQFAFGEGSAPAILINEVSPITSADVNAGKTLPAGQDKDWPVPKTATHLGWRGTTGFFEFCCSETPAV